MQHGATQRLDRIEIPHTWPPPFSDIASTKDLEDPKHCTEWISITDPDAVEYYLQLRNRSHFGQAFHSRSFFRPYYVAGRHTPLR
jgi:hypothetical protein